MAVHGQHYWAERFAADAAQLEQHRNAIKRVNGKRYFD